ncbi:YceD family protein [Pigmentiphaga humi]|nr:YceD family protein [Pigmentiphaga humi]
MKKAAEQREFETKAVETQADTMRYIDAFEFVRVGKSLEGSVPLARFVRLLDGLPEQDPAAMVRWAAQADRGPLGEELIRLDVATALTLRCQRCLGPLAMPIESGVVLQLVQTEAELDNPDTFDMSELAAEQAGEDYEKVLGSRKFDLQEQVEDELILSVPYVPRHERCPGGESEGGDGQERKPSPFAALAQLKSSSGDVGK